MSSSKKSRIVPVGDVGAVVMGIFVLVVWLAFFALVATAMVLMLRHYMGPRGLSLSAVPYVILLLLLGIAPLVFIYIKFWKRVYKIRIAADNWLLLNPYGFVVGRISPQTVRSVTTTQFTRTYHSAPTTRSYDLVRLTITTGDGSTYSALSPDSNDVLFHLGYRSHK